MKITIFKPFCAEATININKGLDAKLRKAALEVHLVASIKYLFGKECEVEIDLSEDYPCTSPAGHELITTKLLPAGKPDD